MPRAHIKYISGLLLFGLNGVVSSRLAMPSMGIVFYRMLLGSLFLLLLLLLKGGAAAAGRAAPPDGGRRALRRFHGPSLGGVLLRAGDRAAGRAAVFRKRLTAAQTACFGVVFAGILLISVPDLSPPAPAWTGRGCCAASPRRCCTR